MVWGRSRRKIEELETTINDLRGTIKDLRDELEQLRREKEEIENKYNAVMREYEEMAFYVPLLIRASGRAPTADSSATDMPERPSTENYSVSEREEGKEIEEGPINPVLKAARDEAIENGVIRYLMELGMRVYDPRIPIAMRFMEEEGMSIDEAKKAADEYVDKIRSRINGRRTAEMVREYYKQMKESLKL
ncbi:MAG: hypothetical protein DRN68_06040 [Thaumarchaeota archaeon]|nr:MAG: hypothetical protein DRN68_06040 [Nitrososphaerota archaeon]